jgi:hypothetical protein
MASSIGSAAQAVPQKSEVGISHKLMDGAVSGIGGQSSESVATYYMNTVYKYNPGSKRVNVPSRYYITEADGRRRGGAILQKYVPVKQIGATAGYLNQKPNRPSKNDMALVNSGQSSFDPNQPRGGSIIRVVGTQGDDTMTQDQWDEWQRGTYFRGSTGLGNGPIKKDGPGKEEKYFDDAPPPYSEEAGDPPPYTIVCGLPTNYSTSSRRASALPGVPTDPSADDPQTTNNDNGESEYATPSGYATPAEYATPSGSNPTSGYATPAEDIQQLQQAAANVPYSVMNSHDISDIYVLNAYGMLSPEDWSYMTQQMLMGKTLGEAWFELLQHHLRKYQTSVNSNSQVNVYSLTVVD